MCEVFWEELVDSRKVLLHGDASAVSQHSDQNETHIVNAYDTEKMDRNGIICLGSLGSLGSLCLSIQHYSEEEIVNVWNGMEDTHMLPGSRSN